MAIRDEDVLEDFPEPLEGEDKMEVEVDDEGVLIDFDPDSPPPAEDSSHGENLAEYLTRDERREIANELVDYIDTDKESRAQWEERLETALQMLGLEDVPEDDVMFEGASRLNHPVIAEACVQFQARAISEYFPPDGPVKTTTVGESSPEKMEQSRRVKEFMNWQLTDQDEEYYDDHDQMLFYLPLDGSTFKKGYLDPETGMPKSRFVSASKFIAPYNAKNLQSCPRYAEEYEMNDNDVLRAMEAGDFIRSELTDATREDDDGIDVAQKGDQVDVVEAEGDNTYKMYEVHIDYSLPEGIDPKADEVEYKVPYVIRVNADTLDVYEVRRNWEEDDKRKRKQVWFIHYRYLPGLGFYGFGLLHIIGSLGKAASGAIRALLDSAALSNFQGGFKSKEARASGEVRLKMGEWQDVDMAAEELAKSFYTPPFREPSQALFALLEILISSAQRFASITEVSVGEGSNQGPVGTTVAMIEQSGKVFSAIHKRLHVAARREFKLIAFLNYQYLPDEYPYPVGGEGRDVLREDFDPEVVDVLPVSDPNIFSETQRVALAQAAFEIVNSDQHGLYTRDQKRAAHRRLLEAMRVPAVDELISEKEVLRLDPVTENQQVLHGNPVRAFQEQDHLAHITVHEGFIRELQQADEEMANQVMPVLKAHIAEHYAWFYRQQIEKRMMSQGGPPMPPWDAHDREDQDELPVDVENDLSRMIASFTQPPPQPGQGNMPGGQQPDPEAMKAQAEIQRKQQEFAAEQKRKDMEARAKIEREDELAAAKQRRENIEHQLELAREQEEWLAQQQREDRSEMRETERESAGLVSRLMSKLKGGGDSEGDSGNRA